jgi:hypothetical protein
MLPRLEGQTQSRPNREQELTESIEALKQMNNTLEAEVGRWRRAIQALRTALEPQYLALQAIFGEIEITGITDGSFVTNYGDNPKRRVWQGKIEKFKGNLQGKMLSALLEYGPQTADQLRIHMGCTKQSVYNTYDRLVKMGFVFAQGGKYSLKEL